MIILDLEQYSEEWWTKRAGKPSASNAKKLVTSTGAESKQMADYSIELANDLYAEKALDMWGGNSHTDRGHELEPEARDYYQFITGSDVVVIGMALDNEESYIASPDGIVNDSGVLEIKCLSGKYHTKALLYYAKNKKIPPDYAPQVQMQMMVTERQWCDLLFFHPDLPSLIIRNTPNAKIVVTLKDQLTNCISERDRIVDILRRYN